MLFRIVLGEKYRITNSYSYEEMVFYKYVYECIVVGVRDAGAVERAGIKKCLPFTATINASDRWFEHACNEA